MQRGAGGEGVSAAVEALERRRAAAQADDTRRRTDVGHELRRQLPPSTGGIGDLQVAELGRHWGEVGGPQPQKHGRDRR